MIETLDIQEYIKTPIKENIDILLNHFGRYIIAIRELEINKNDFVYDIACGQGYGSYILSHYANFVIGYDVNNDYLNIAKNLFKKNNIDFIPAIGFTFDKIICIETIEHLKKENQEEFLIDLCNKLKKRGKLFLTFPIGENEESLYNNFHKCEPSLDRIEKILNKYLHKIKIEIDKYVNNYNEEIQYCFIIGEK